MVLVFDKIAVADFALGKNVAAGKWYEKSLYPRIIAGITLTGSAAAGDCACEISGGTLKIGEIYNVATGVPTGDTQIIKHSSRQTIKPQESIMVKVTDAAATNDVYLVLDIIEITPKTSSFKKYTRSY